MRRRAGFIGLLVLAAVAVVGAGLWFAPSWLVGAIAARDPGCAYAFDVKERVVALTIDDGPDSATTPAIARVLAAHDARATFFVISSRVAGNDSIVGSLVRAGHELGNHMTTDQPSRALSAVAFESDAREAGAVFDRFAPVRWLRPGSGWHDRTMVSTIERLGYRCALGSIYPFDAQLPWSGLARSYILSNVEPGSVIVLHDGGSRGRRTVATLEGVLPALRDRGYRVVTLTELERIATGERRRR